MSVRVAAVAWQLRHVRGDSEFFGHYHDLVTTAHDEGAEIVVFPELPILELLGLAPDLEDRHIPKFLIQFATEMEAWLERISRSSGMILVGGSHFRPIGEEIAYGCTVAYPSGSLVFSPKNRLSRYELDFWNLVPGTSIPAQRDRRLAVTVGYDAEFPEAGRAIAESGALIQCVPGLSLDRQGFERTRRCCQARAIENQFFVVHSCLVGSIGRELAMSSFGTSAILTPDAPPFGLATLAETWPNAEGVVVSNLDLEMLAQCRSGPARNWVDRSVAEWGVEESTVDFSS